MVERSRFQTFAARLLPGLDREQGCIGRGSVSCSNRSRSSARYACDRERHVRRVEREEEAAFDAAQPTAKADQGAKSGCRDERGREVQPAVVA